jgi:hypothetical protein
MRPTSVPVVPAQPNRSNYPVEALALFQTFSRDSYLSTFGVQAAAWNPARAPKYWFDSTVDASASSVSYVVFNPAAASFQTLTLTGAEAATVNLPGTLSYAPYVIAPTKANRAGAPITPQWLSLQADAMNLMAQLGGSGLMDVGAVGSNPVLYPSDEPRRMWTFVLNGTPINAGLLLAMQNAAGVGAPGHWDLSSPGNPSWVSTPPPTRADDPSTAVPLPLRALLPNERLVPSPLGLGSASVVRDDMGANGGVAGGDAFTAADRATLQKILDAVTK